MDSRGPLTGLRIIEMEGIGPAPFAAMLLADMGAEVIRITRPEASGLGIERPPEFELPARGRRSVAMDLKNPEAVACALDLIARADGLIEGFRPGVMEWLGLGPEPCLDRNPRLVYGRMTGWGQTGPLAPRAGHDVNYLALTGLLDMIGREGQPPTIPLNLLADYAGGSLMLVIGMLAALLHAKEAGQGQVIDAAMVDGAALLGTAMTGLRASGIHKGERGTNILDGGLPEYSVYECADGRYLSVGALEPKFRKILLEGLGLDEADAPRDGSPESRIKARAAIAGRIRQHDRDEWVARFEGLDACVAPVLSQEEAALHPHNAARENHVEIAGIVQPAPAPRFSATPAPTPSPPERPGASGEAVLAEWGLSAERIEALLQSGAVIAGDEGEGGS
ncbi:CaiB/BaiF CoA transferase family protein [Paracoccus saliphilus]|uniref:Alpha-methylacyl-CoA racemase n=1 Tax=Paracoccus saliphilus TaxID=405559 RepID=A0AA46A6F4_9RHOB|nr:CaiB/BaiF CoA-transferase family protein [Paracoccus saliphilus]WCR05459.1 CoA transferase [Paracoccus saliphilus]SIS96974.1 alpha-methylacyl-CoA racemase [Paracoccus saliphilus]